MAQLNARQKRARKERLAQREIALKNAQFLTPFEGVMKSSQASFEGSRHRPAHGTYKVAAVRPKIVIGKRKSGPVENVTRDHTISVPNPDMIEHRGNLAKRPANGPRAKRWGLTK